MDKKILKIFKCNIELIVIFANITLFIAYNILMTIYWNMYIANK